MHLVRFRVNDSVHRGIKQGTNIIEIDSHPDDSLVDIALREDFDEISTFDQSDVSLLPPVASPGKLVCVGLNYRDHAIEGGNEIPDTPLLFSKAPSTVIGPGETIHYPENVTKLDYEAELAVVIGKRGRDISAANADEYIAGFTAFNDISARDVQYAHSQYFRGKSFDTFGPLGPTLATMSVDSASNLPIRSYVNGEKRQNAKTDEMLFTVPEIVQDVSRIMTLNPGDVLSTGTPAGVGAHNDDSALLSPGDTVRVSIGDIGDLKNTVDIA